MYSAQPMVDSAVIGTGAPGRRERKKQATRTALRQAAIALALERGFANVTVEDICDAVDVSVRTFFNYFPSKEAALVGGDPAQLVALAAELRALPAALEPLAALRAVLIERLPAVSADLGLAPGGAADGAARLAALRAQPEVLAAYAKHLVRLEHLLADAVLDRLGGGERLRPYARVVTAAALAAVRVATTSFVGAAGGPALADQLGVAFDALADGLRPPAPSAARGRRR